MLFIDYQVAEETSLGEYLEDQIDLASPILLFVKTGEDLGYDHSNYYSFGKRGRSFIPKDRFIGREGLTQSDVDILQRRYQKYKHTPIITSRTIKDKPKIRLYERVDRDISRILLGHAVNGIRRIINKC